MRKPRKHIKCSGVFCLLNSFTGWVGLQLSNPRATFVKLSNQFSIMDITP